MLASAVFWTFYAIIVLAIYQVNFNSIFVPLSSLILGAPWRPLLSPPFSYSRPPFSLYRPRLCPRAGNPTHN